MRFPERTTSKLSLTLVTESYDWIGPAMYSGITISRSGRRKGIATVGGMVHSLEMAIRCIRMSEV